MEKVFIYCEKMFFVENGTDYSAAIDNGKIFVFRSQEDAYLHLKREVEKYRDNNPGVRKSRFASENNFGIVLKSSDGRRYVFEIIGKDLY